MAALKRKDYRTGLERRVRPRIENESDLEDRETSSEAAQSHDESDSDNSGEALGSDGDSENVRKFNGQL